MIIFVCLYEWCIQEWYWENQLDNKKLELTLANMKKAAANNSDMKMSNSDSGLYNDLDSGFNRNLRRGANNESDDSRSNTLECYEDGGRDMEKVEGVIS